MSSVDRTRPPWYWNTLFYGLMFSGENLTLFGSDLQALQFNICCSTGFSIAAGSIDAAWTEWWSQKLAQQCYTMTSKGNHTLDLLNNLCIRPHASIQNARNICIFHECWQAIKYTTFLCSALSKGEYLLSLYLQVFTLFDIFHCALQSHLFFLFFSTFYDIMGYLTWNYLCCFIWPSIGQSPHWSWSRIDWAIWFIYAIQTIRSLLHLL